MANRNNGICFNKFTPRGAESRTVENHQERIIINNNNHIIIDDKKDKNVHSEDYQVALQVMIIKAVGIDNQIHHNPLALNRHYNVVYWVVPGEELRTRLTTGFDPFWNEKGLIFLDNLDDHVFLNVEVQRFNSKVDPGTSCGKVVVGRARIPLPKELYRKRMGSFSLVRIEGERPKAEGQIVVVMRLEMFKLNYRHSSALRL